MLHNYTHCCKLVILWLYYQLYLKHNDTITLLADIIIQRKFQCQSTGKEAFTYSVMLTVKNI